MSVIDEVLENDAPYAESFENGDLAGAPGLGRAVVACLDARLDTHRLLGIEEGDQHVIRNAGGVIADDASGNPSPASRPAPSSLASMTCAASSTDARRGC